jgi:hypothetical protein
VSLLADRLLAVDDALSKAELPHAFGGAIALGYCTLEPRGTRDLDLNVFVAPERVKEVFAALPDGVTVTALNVEQAERDGQVRVWWQETPIDVFLDVLPLHAEVAREVRRVPFSDRMIPVLGCNALAVFKAMFDRTRDWADIEAMVEAKALDIEATAARVRALEGDESQRAARLLELRN